MPLPSFTITGNVFDILGNVAGGELVENAFGAGQSVTVLFTPNLKANRFVTFNGKMERVKAVQATINSDGEIRRNGDAVLLAAEDPGWNFTGLQWFVDITGME